MIDDTTNRKICNGKKKSKKEIESINSKRFLKIHFDPDLKLVLKLLKIIR